MERKRKNKSKIVPSDDSESVQGHVNPAFEMAVNNISASSKFRDVTKDLADKHNALRVISNVKHAASKWSNYVTKKRIRKQNNPIESLEAEKRNIERPESVLSHDQELEKPKTGGIGLDDIHSDYETNTIKGPPTKGKGKNMSLSSSRALMQHFAKLGQSKNDETLDLYFVEALLNSGADINCCDKYGQTILHEVARAWHTDVAKFLLEYGADIDKPDMYGRTPLHVAAAVDYPEMVFLLIEKGANKEALTKDENQTPVHYAAKNDAVNSLRALIKQKCLYKDIKDYKGRTPIHVAAELDRSETARLLLELQAPVGVSDNKGQKAITWMITKMAPVASEALTQFRTTDRPNRKQYYYLNLLVQDRELDPSGNTQTPLQVTVTFRQYDLLMMQVFRRLIDTMWFQFGRRGAWKNLLINFVYILLWSAIGILVEYDKRHIYVWPDQWWRVVLLLFAIFFTVWQVAEELREFNKSRRAHKNWVKWRTSEIEEDLRYCHPRWPEEEAFLKSEMKALEDQSPKYFNDAWNIFDWLCYFMLLVCIGTHFADIAVHSELLARWHIRFMCITVILLWLRLMKCARAFTLLGPFIVMLGKMIGDLIRFAFLYLEFYIPYACAFWMIFGGDKRSESDHTSLLTVGGFETPQDMMFSLFRITLVDEYDYDSMKQVDSLMAGILVATWLSLSAVMCLNLLIALLSDTFQRVYDNAKANSVMQKAITILGIWEGMSKKKRIKFLDFIQRECSPQADYYDDDLTQSGEEDLKKVTLMIKDQLDEMQDSWNAKFGGIEAGVLGDGTSTMNKSAVVTNEKFDSEVKDLKKTMDGLRLKQEEFADRFRRDMKAVKTLLTHLLNQGGSGGGAGIDFGGLPELAPTDSRMSLDTQEDEPRTRMRKMKKRKSKGEELLVPFDDSTTRRSPHAEITTVEFPDLDADEEA